MLDYQLVMVAREVSRERVQGLSPAVTAKQRNALHSFFQGRHAMTAFLTSLAAKSVNMVMEQRFQHRHRSVEGRT